MKRNNLLLSLLCIVLLLSGCTNVSNNSSTDINISKPAEIEYQEDVLATIYYFDVGQADSTLIISDDNVLLIDTGDVSTSDKMIDYLDDIGITKINYLVLTHPHSDHIGGAPDIIEKYNIDNILMPNKTTTTKIFEDTVDIIAEKDYNITVPKQGTEYKIGDGLFTILSNQDIDWGDDLNDSSIILRVEFGETSFIFSGDANEQVEENVLESNMDVSSTVLKVGHHGSYTSTSSNYLNAVNPKYAIISCGLNNDYGHPHDVILDKLQNKGVTYYRTDKSGTIVATTNGKDITFSVNAESESDDLAQTEVVSEDDRVYILNVNTKKIHSEDCEYADSISESNRKVFTGNIEEILSEGYSYCKSCGGE